MSLQLLIGRSGTGKTDYILTDIARKSDERPDGPPLWLITPDQMTFHSESQLVKKTKRGGTIRASVYSFPRLAAHVLQRVGGAGRFINRTGIHMILRKIIEEHREKLRVFQRACDRRGFYELLEEMLAECKHYCVQPEMLADASRRLSAEDHGSDILLDKLQDIRLIAGELEKHLQNKYVDGEDLLSILSRKIPHYHGIGSVSVWVDGFYSFTPQELLVLQQLLRYGARLTVSLTLDMIPKEEPQEGDPFFSSAATYRRLVELAQNSGVPVLETIRFEKNLRHRSKALIHLERTFSRRPPQPFSRKQTDGVSFFACPNPRAEVEQLAARILTYVREEQGRFRDVAVLCRDLNRYRPYLETIFTDDGIPLFIDERKSMIHHPLVEFIRSSLEAIQHGWPYEAIFRAVKTDLLFPSDSELPLEELRRGMDELENHVLSRGIRGKKKWLSQEAWRDRNANGDWKAKERRRLNFKEMITSPLEKLERALKRAKSNRELIQALYLYLERLEIPQKLEQMRAKAERDGNLNRAREHEQVWRTVIELFDQVDELVGDQGSDLKQLLDMLETGLETARFSLVPPALDHVLVGNLDRTRSVDVPVVFLIGANEGVMPATPRDEGLVTDEERDWLRRGGIQLAPGSERRLQDEEFFAYLALSGAKNKLFISYALADEEGRAQQPSIYVNRLKKIFPSVREQVIDPEYNQDGIENMTTPRRTVSALARRLRAWKDGQKLDSIWWDAYNILLQDASWKPAVNRIVRALFYRNAETALSPKTAAALFGKTLKTSVTKMERFQACPFQHFAEAGLKLKEREEYRLEAPDIGEMFHEALNRITERLQETATDWRTLDKKAAWQLAHEAVQEIQPQFSNQILLSSYRYKAIARKLTSIVARAVHVMSKQAQSSGFSPVGAEVSFGEGGKLPALTITLADGRQIKLGGRIDRIDASRTDEEAWIRIIDYKSSHKRLPLAEVYFGISLQMLAYLDVVLAHAERWLGEKADPAGVLYFHLHDPFLQEKKPLSSAEIEDKLFRKFQMDGLVMADEEVVRLMDRSISGQSQIIPVALKKNGGFYKRSRVADRQQWNDLRRYVRRLMAEVGTRVMEGQIDISPYKLADRTPCTYCSFKPVCQFDPAGGNDYRLLKNLEDHEALKKISTFLDRPQVSKEEHNQKGEA